MRRLTGRQIALTALVGLGLAQRVAWLAIVGVGPATAWVPIVVPLLLGLAFAIIAARPSWVRLPASDRWVAATAAGLVLTTALVHIGPMLPRRASPQDGYLCAGSRPVGGAHVVALDVAGRRIGQSLGPSTDLEGWFRVAFQPGEPRVAALVVRSSGQESGANAWPASTRRAGCDPQVPTRLGRHPILEVP